MKGSYHSITYTFLATLFLWILFSSYNAGLGTDQFRLYSLFNTIFALISWAVSSFGMSYLYNGGKLYTDHILNSTLASGIMVGSCW